MSKSTFEEQLDKYGSFTYRNTGISMMPLLKQGRDLFTVRKKQPGERLKKYDVALYRRGDQYVLHRVLELIDGGYIIRGDNCLNKENVKENDIIAVMTEYVHKGKAHTVEDKAFISYTKRMMFFSPIRIFYGKSKIKLKNKLKRLLKGTG